MTTKTAVTEVRFEAGSLKAETRHPTNPEKDDIFDPWRQETFESRILLEVVTNYVVQHGCPLIHHDGVPLHHRGHAMELAEPLHPTYERYRYMTVMAGPSFKNIQRQQQVHGSHDYWASSKFRDDDPRTPDAALVPVLLPDKWKKEDREKRAKNDITPGLHYTEENFLWVDLTYPLRGVYIPNRLENPGDPDSCICIYTHISFSQPHEALDAYTYVPPEEVNPDEEYVTEEPDVPGHERQRQKNEPDKWEVRFITESKQMSTSPALGWGVEPKWTVRIDVAKLRELPQDPSSCFKLFDAAGLVIRIGGELRLRVEQVKKDPQHTMNRGEVIQPVPDPLP
ncbi:hypothetical protein FQN55_002991 [Onygenales sp. PD_40]|nr:hypothetical protein FQN55_002991 [Onygenales sp. PD_40]KAK2793789.1 hypothetical protein FQN52_000741 [Onygenales sp. PD_12]